MKTSNKILLLLAIITLGAVSASAVENWQLVGWENQGAPFWTGNCVLQSNGSGGSVCNGTCTKYQKKVQVCEQQPKQTSNCTPGNTSDFQISSTGCQIRTQLGVPVGCQPCGSGS